MALEKLIRNPSLGSSFGKAGHERVIKYFSFKAFTERLNGLISDMI